MLQYNSMLLHAKSITCKVPLAASCKPVFKDQNVRCFNIPIMLQDMSASILRKKYHIVENSEISIIRTLIA